MSLSKSSKTRMPSSSRFDSLAELTFAIQASIAMLFIDAKELCGATFSRVVLC